VTLNSLIPANDYPVLRNIFPVNLRRELCEKSLRRSGFLLRNRLLGPEIAEFPVKFPVSREFAWRQARSTLRRQPGIPHFREFPSLDEKGPPNAGFSHRQ
jgi:hypothetical protein